MPKRKIPDVSGTDEDSNKMKKRITTPNANSDNQSNSGDVTGNVQSTASNTSPNKNAEMQAITQTMSLDYLETHLGVKYEALEGGEILCEEKWRLANGVDSLGRTRLMEAAEGGAVRCVDFLLKCGLDVNAVDPAGRRAINYAVEGGREGDRREEILLLLLRHDSLLPKESSSRKRFEATIRENEGLQKFFAERDQFHKWLPADTDANSVKEAVRKAKTGPKYWVNRKGNSALYTATVNKCFDAWAFLKSEQFACVDGEEGDMKPIEEIHKVECGWAMEKYFIAVPNIHVFKMVSRSKVLGNPEGMSGTLKEIYDKLDEVKMTSLLLKCLQDEVRFEVVFDPEKSDISRMCAGMTEDDLGATVFFADRVYVGTGESEGFDRSDVLSTLVHELTHKAMDVVFANGGLPYGKNDSENKKRYDDIVSKITSPGRFEGLDSIIKKVKEYPKKLHPMELIVRVPEVVSKYHASEKDGFEILRTQARELLDFYSEHVMPEMEKYVEKTKMATVISTADFLKSLRSVHRKDFIEVARTESPKIRWCCSLRVLKVSNLKLGLSHLEKTQKGLVSVDWRTYEKYENCLRYGLERGQIKSLAVVFDENLEPEFQATLKNIRDDGLASRLQRYLKFVTIVVPKQFSIPGGMESIDYTWGDLVVKTKTFVLERKVQFQGRGTSLKELLGGAVGGEDKGSLMEKLMDAEALSTFLDHDEVVIGNPIERMLETRRRELLRNHPESVIQRRTRVRPLVFSKETFDWRARDAFFIVRNARTVDPEFDEMYKVSVWDGGEVPQRSRCFLLSGDSNRENGDALSKGVVDKLKEAPCPGATDGGKWQFAHFFRREDKNEYTHILSREIHRNPAVIIAGAPGSGKSVFVNTRALEAKEQTPWRWVEVFELTSHEGRIKRWMEERAKSKKTVEDKLFDLIKGMDVAGSGNSSLEKEVFKLFCRGKERMVVFFDGFDEIKSSNKDSVLSFLKAVQQETEVSLVVTSRTHECADLEKRLSTIARFLVPLDNEQQVKFFAAEWRASLGSMPEGDLVEKVRRMISGLQSSHSMKDKRATTQVIESLGRLSSGNAVEIIDDVDLESLTKELVNWANSEVEGEGSLFATPLHCWMLCSVVFEENFNFKKVLNLSELYRRFVEIKIRLYAEEKAKTSDTAAGSTLMESHKRTTYKQLKQFSVYFFLEDVAYRLRNDEIRDLLRVGLLVRSGDSYAFVHRTLGEYLFSLWLLEMAKEEKVTNVWLSRVLPGMEFEKVRKFIDTILISEPKKLLTTGRVEEGTELEWFPLNPSALSSTEDWVESIQKGLLTSVVECHGGILRYLLESSVGYHRQVMFGEVRSRVGGLRSRVRGLAITIVGRRKTRLWNAFTLCGECIRGDAWADSPSARRSNTDYVQILLQLLRFAREKNLIVQLRELVSTEGLWWMGVGEDELWTTDEGKVLLKSVIEFLGENRDAMGAALRTKILNDKTVNVFLFAAVHAFDLFVYILDWIIGEENLANLFLKNENFTRAWTGVVQRCELGAAERMWGLVRGKLDAKGQRKCLKRKDGSGWNALFSAFTNEDHSDLVPFVWGLFRERFYDGDCKSILMESFDGVKDARYWFNLRPALEWVHTLLNDGFLDAKEATRVLLSRDDEGDRYLLRLESFHQPPAFHALQDLARKLNSSDILKNTKGFSKWLAHSCLSNSDWVATDPNFVAMVRGMRDGSHPSPGSFPVPAEIQSAEGEFLATVLSDSWHRIHKVQLEAFLALLERQVEMEDRILGRRELLERLAGEWIPIYYAFPRSRTKEDGTEVTRAFWVPCFFAAVSKVLSRQEVAKVLLPKKGDGETAVHFMLHYGDPWAFLALYDVARWSLGEEALCRVHSVGEGGKYFKKKPLVHLMELQERGEFEKHNPTDTLSPP